MGFELDCALWLHLSFFRGEGEFGGDRLRRMLLIGRTPSDAGARASWARILIGCPNNQNMRSRERCASVCLTCGLYFARLEFGR